MNNQTKVVLGAIAAVFAASLILRFVLLSQAGVPGGWIFYLGLPFGGIVTVLVLLLRLGVLNFGEKPRATIQHWQHHAAGQATQPSPAPIWMRLQELETLRSNGAVSETEYAAKRARIISGI